MADPHPPQFSEALFEVAALLESLAVPYLVYGAVAVGIWGRVRSTLDVDFMVLTNDAGLVDVETAAVAAGMVVDHRWLEWNPQRRGVQVLVAQRDHDLTDAVSIVEEQQGQLDEEYLYSWARRLGVEQELTCVLRGGTFDFGPGPDTR